MRRISIRLAAACERSNVKEGLYSIWWGVHRLGDSETESPANMYIPNCINFAVTSGQRRPDEDMLREEDSGVHTLGDTSALVNPAAQLSLIRRGKTSMDGVGIVFELYIAPI